MRRSGPHALSGRCLRRSRKWIEHAVSLGEGADEQLLAAIDALTPSHVLMFGESGGCAQITPERVAINIDDYAIADNAGHQPRGEPVVVDRPVG